MGSLCDVDLVRVSKVRDRWEASHVQNRLDAVAKVVTGWRGRFLAGFAGWRKPPFRLGKVWGSLLGFASASGGVGANAGLLFARTINSVVVVVAAGAASARTSYATSPFAVWESSRPRRCRVRRRLLPWELLRLLLLRLDM